MIKNFTPRLYQQTILNTAIDHNTLVVLPTGLGKTNLFLMIAAQRLKAYPNSKVVLMGPTRPLIDQYRRVFENHFQISKDDMAVFTGQVTPENRQILWEQSRVVFTTPQGLENDVITKKISLEDVSLLGFDEAHRATGDYSYVFLAKQYESTAKNARIIGLTASPGTDLESISQICDNLYVEEIEVRTDQDPDVKEYIQDVKIDWIKVDLPEELIEIQKCLKEFLMDRLGKLKKYGVLHRTNLSGVSKTELLSIQAQLRGRIASGENDYVMWTAISVLAEVMKIQHAVELLETQGIVSLYFYMDGINKQAVTSKTKAVQNIVKDFNFRKALGKSQVLYDNGVKHPKLVELVRIISSKIKSDGSVKIIVFNQYRDNASEIVSTLENAGVKTKLFVGQTKKSGTGMNQKEQKEIIKQFSEGQFNVLVGTSVTEEGLDIPQVDEVYFYEPIPSAIRTIQRRGRTGRQEKGKVTVLMANNTRDEGYRWSAHHKEKRMYRVLEGLKKKLKLKDKKPEQSILSSFESQTPLQIYVDHREKGNKIVKDLMEMGINIKLESLEAGDYLLGNKVCIEFKTKEDFVNSLVDGRLLEQVKSVKNCYSMPLILVEGVEDIYSIRNVHPNAIRGLLITITARYGVPILYSKNSKESALIMAMIAKKEQGDSGSDFSPHSSKRVASLKEQQEYFVSALPNVGTKLARELLKKFKTVHKLVNASSDELMEIDKMGSIKAKGLKDVFEVEYK